MVVVMIWVMEGKLRLSCLCMRMVMNVILDSCGYGTR